MAADAPASPRLAAHLDRQQGGRHGRTCSPFAAGSMIVRLSTDRLAECAADNALLP
jgi:hypothetical protein